METLTKHKLNFFVTRKCNDGMKENWDLPFIASTVEKYASKIGVENV